MTVPQRAREYGGVAMFLMVTTLFCLWVLLGPTTVNNQNQEILRGVRHEINVHAEADADRTCATTKLIVFIIEKGYQRAEKLGTSGPEPASVKKRLDGYIEDACRVVVV